MLKSKKELSIFSCRAARTIQSVCFVTLAMGAVASVTSAQQVSLSLPTGSAIPGGSVTLALSAANSGGSEPTAIQWSMTYPASDITSVSVAAASAATLASKSVSCHSTSGSTICIVSGMNDTAIAPGTLASITFNISSTATDSSAAIQLSGLDAAASNGTGIAETGTGGTISINHATPATLKALSCIPTSITTPASATCTVALTGSASSNGTSVSLQSNNSNLKVPTSVSIASGQTSTTFTATTASVSNTQSAIITAAANGATETATLTLSPPSAPVILISSLACTPTTIYSAGSATCMATLTKSAAAKTSISLSSNNTLLTVPSSISISAGSSSANFTATSGTISKTQTGVITATGPNNSQTFTETLTAGSASAKSVSIWSSSAVPGTITEADSNSVELGLAFTSDVAGTVNGVRFYKGPYNTGTHVGHLWTSNGTLLGAVTFTNETATGWQQANFSKPITIQANTVYVVSYYCPAGYYPDDEWYFQNSGVNSAPLHALQNTSTQSNGVYVYGTGGFPNQGWNASNYWVDLVFTP